MDRTLNAAAILALGLAVSFAAMNSEPFLGFAIHADTLYPALLVETVRADPAALLRFQPSRVPSFVPDLAIAALIDAMTGSWRLAFWGYAALAFAMLSLLGGWIARVAFGPAARFAGAWLALILAMLVGLALLEQAHVAGLAADGSAPPPLPANLHVMLLMPVWQSGAFIAGLAVLCLVWRAAQRCAWPRLLGLGLFAAIAVASNTIVVAHAVLPGLIALADGALRRALPWRAALRIALVLALAVAAGFGLGLATGRLPLPGGATGGLAAALRAMPGDLLREPALLLMLLSSVPIGLAFLMPGRSAARLPQGGDPAAIRFFVVAAAAACAAAVSATALFYHGPHAWRYGNPIAWWPAIFLAGILARRWHRGAVAGALLLAGGIGGVSAAAGGAGAPALMRWRPPELACLDAADPGVTWRAGLAAYWHARTIAAASGWRRQVESTDFGDARPFLWIQDPRSHVQSRHAAPGTPPPYRFILMTGLDPAAISRIHGMPERVLPCGGTSLWIYPEGWDPLDRLIGMADALIPEALAIGRRVCTTAEHLAQSGTLSQGRIIALPPGRWRVGLHHGGSAAPAGWRVLAEPDGAMPREAGLGPDAGVAEVTLGDPATATRLRLRLLPGDAAAPALLGLSIRPADAAPFACVFPQGGPDGRGE